MIIIAIFSFYLEGIFTKILNMNSFLIPLFSLISLIIIFPFLYNKHKYYYILCFGLGLIYDISYTNTIFLNAFMFLFIGYIITKLNLFITNNTFNVMLLTIVVIILYRVLTYIVLVTVGYQKLNYSNLFDSIVNSLLINILYGVIMYKIMDRLSIKKDFYKMD